MNDLPDRLSPSFANLHGGLRLLIIGGDVMSALRDRYHDGPQIIHALCKKLPVDAFVVTTNGQLFGAVKAKEGKGYRDAVGMLVASKEWPATEEVEEIEIRLEDVANVKVPLE